jgi:hypothetical protein
LYGVGDDAGETTFRLRHAWGELGQFGAGQTYDPALGAGIVPWNQFPDATAQFRYGGDWGHVQVAGIFRVLGAQGPDNYAEQTIGWGGTCRAS